MNFSRGIAAIALLVIVIALVAFSYYNMGQSVDVRLLWFRTFYGMDLNLALLGAFVLGVALTLLYCLYYFVDLGLNVRRLKKRNRALESELAAIRNLPIEEALGCAGLGEETEGKEVAP
jgi:uncharacterized membrane protein